MDPSAFLNEFRQEASERLQALQEQLCRLEAGPGDLELVRQMFLAAHTIKANAAMVKLDRIRDLAHALEDVLVALRDGQVVLVVEDDGEGFKPGRAVDGEKGMGLLSMKERAALVGGTLEIESEPGRGATLYARVPVKYA